MDYPPVAFRLTIPLFISLFLLAGCSDPAVEISLYDVSVSYDYQNDSDFPSERLSVFMGFSSEVRRLEEMKVRCNESKEEWNITEPVVISSGSSQWMGYPELKAQDGKNFTNGSYSVTVKDSQGHEKKGAFTLKYDERFEKLTSLQARETVPSGARERVAVYSSDGNLIFFDRPKEEWKDDEAMFWRAFKNGHHARTVYSFENTVCLMPVKYKSIQEQ